ncbi:hypothetical protein JHW43_006215, partial [Diplocarpon mali]
SPQCLPRPLLATCGASVLRPDAANSRLELYPDDKGISSFFRIVSRANREAGMVRRISRVRPAVQFREISTPGQRVLVSRMLCWIGGRKQEYRQGGGEEGGWEMSWALIPLCFPRTSGRDSDDSQPQSRCQVRGEMSLGRRAGANSWARRRLEGTRTSGGDAGARGADEHEPCSPGTLLSEGWSDPRPRLTDHRPLHPGASYVHAFAVRCGLLSGVGESRGSVYVQVGQPTDFRLWAWERTDLRSPGRASQHDIDGSSSIWPPSTPAPDPELDRGSCFCLPACLPAIPPLLPLAAALHLLDSTCTKYRLPHPELRAPTSSFLVPWSLVTTTRHQHTNTPARLSTGIPASAAIPVPLPVPVQPTRYSLGSPHHDDGDSWIPAPKRCGRTGRKNKREREAKKKKKKRKKKRKKNTYTRRRRKRSR